MCCYTHNIKVGTFYRAIQYHLQCISRYGFALLYLVCQQTVKPRIKEVETKEKWYSSSTRGTSFH